MSDSIEDGGNGETYERLDCFNWGLQKKAEGKIRHFGFSFHGSPAYLIQVLDAHPEIEFVQIQLNYADWKNPLVRSGELYEILHSRNIPMIIMEPVKGGTLASLKPELEEMYRAVRPDASIASWALLSSGGAAVFLYRKDGEPVGFAQCQLRHDYVEGTESSPVGYLEGVWVKETERRRGIARELVSACERWAKEQGCSEFASDCELTNMVSQAFHRAIGFEEANRLVAYVRKI